MAGEDANTSSQAQAAIAQSINAALQGDAVRAREALRTAPAEAFSDKDAAYRDCMIERFGRDSPPPLAADEHDPVVGAILAMYREYWHAALMKPSRRDAEGDSLKRRLASFLGDADAAASWDEIEKRIDDRLLERGVHAQLGNTPPLRELMIWRKQDSKMHKVALPEGAHDVRVDTLDDFVALGWSAYARCDRGSNGGWVGEDRIYAVAPAFTREDGPDAFNASLLGHETQHFADMERFPGLADWELEYRAKLTELWTARQTLPKILDRFEGSQSDDRSSPHTYANKRVLNDVRTQLEGMGIESTRANLSDVPADKVRAAASEVLKNDSRRRGRRSGFLRMQGPHLPA
jgi:hypothetical protein